MKKTGQVEGKGTITVERGSRGEREPGRRGTESLGRAEKLLPLTSRLGRSRPSTRNPLDLMTVRERGHQ